MYGIPNIFINCSYPFDKNWSKSSFNRVSLKSVINNTNLHLISYIWCARVIAEEMKLKKINGSIIQFSSTYGIVGQNSRLYMGTNLKENAEQTRSTFPINLGIFQLNPASFTLRILKFPNCR